MTFELTLFDALVVTGVIGLADRLLSAPRRSSEAEEPLLSDYSRSFFPVILIIFLVGSLLVDPFRIPFCSMVPTLLAGVFILGNRYVYGSRLPLINKNIIGMGNPQCSGVMVFRYPLDPSLDYMQI